jgi:nucleoside-diphosphate-sugar epimerase
VGRQILRSLAARGALIRAVVREDTAVTGEDAASIESVIRTPDLFAESARWWTRACDGIDTIVHAAWYAEPGQYLQSSKNMQCLIGTLELARGAVVASVRRVVGVGSCAEYDQTTHDGILSVETPLGPSSLYAAAKAAAFLGLVQWLPAHHVDFAWCRLFYLYGEGEDSRRLVPYLRQNLSRGDEVELTSGNQIRDFLDVRDAGRMIADVALGDRQGPINICSGVPMSVRELAERIADEYGRRDLLRFGARPDSPFDPPRVVGLANSGR